MKAHGLKSMMLFWVTITALSLALPWAAQAAAVGTFTLVEGRVDLMKKGQAPATPVKVQDTVEPGDVVRTKPESKAQLKFIDDTVLTISPESRVGIEEYMYNAQKNERNAALQIFRGMVHAVVSKIIKLEEPDFIVKTHTSILGVRGTSFFVNLAPLHTDLYNESGKMSAKNTFSEVRGTEIVGTMQFTRISMGLPPTKAMAITPEDLQTFKNRLVVRSGGSSTGGDTGGTGGDTSGIGGTGGTGGDTSGITGDTGGTAGTGGTGGTGFNPPPTPPPPAPPKPLAFTQDYSGIYIKTSSEASNFQVADYYNSGNPSPSGTGTRVGGAEVSPGSFNAAYFLTATSTQENTFSAYSTGAITFHMDGKYMPPTGGAQVTGTMTLTGLSAGDTFFSFTNVPFKIENRNLVIVVPPGLPPGTLPPGTFTLGTLGGTLAGTWTQFPQGSVSGTLSRPPGSIGSPLGSHLANYVLRRR